MTLKDAVIRKAYPPEYIATPTQVDGLKVKAERGQEAPHMLKRALGRLALSGKLLYSARSKKNAYESKEAAARDRILDMIAQFPTLRGFNSEKDDLDITVYPKTSIKWNVPALKESLGPAYTAVAGEDLKVTITVPLGHNAGKGPITSKRVETALRSGLRRLGFDNNDLDSLVHSENAPRVDVKKIGELLLNNQVQLSEEAGTVTETWTVDINNPH